MPVQKKLIESTTYLYLKFMSYFYVELGSSIPNKKL